MKKIISFVCCLAPLGAGAATFVENPGTGNAYSAGNALNAVNDTYVIQSGNGIVAGSGGITVAESMYIGLNNPSGTSDGYVYVETAADNPYTIRTDGSISVGALLQVLGGRTVGIHAYTPNSQIAQATFGQINANGALTISDVNKFESGAITGTGDLSITAGSIKSGAITSDAGDTLLTATGKLTMAQLKVQGADAVTTINAGSIDSGDIQNGAGTGLMKINAGTGVFNVMADAGAGISGSIGNSGAGMNIDAGALTVDGTIKNDAGTMTINAASLAVNGGNATNPSLINTSTMNITVAGASTFANDLYVSGAGAQTSLTTGTLLLNGTSKDLLNDSNKFVLNVTAGGVALGRITNSATVTNANMDLTAQSVTATNVSNNGGSLSIATAADSDGDITITGLVSGATNNSTTEIIADGALAVQGNVSNNGAMVLNGKTVDVKSISNDGNSLEVLAYTDQDGRVTIGNADGATPDDIGGNVTNKSGTTTIEGRQIQILGTVLNNGGTTTIRGSDTAGSSIEIGAVNVTDGVVNLDALIGSATIGNTLNVGTNGALNVLRNLAAITVDQNIDIAGDVTIADAAATGNGNVNAVAGNGVFKLASTNGNIAIGGSVQNITGTDHAVTLEASDIEIGGDVAAVGTANSLVFGSAGATTFKVDGNVSANNGGSITIFADDIDVGTLTGDGKFVVYGSQITANGENPDENTSAIDIKKGLWFAGTDEDAGLLVDSAINNLTIETTTTGADISIAGGARIDSGKTLTVASAGDAAFDGAMTMNGVLDVNAENVTLGGITNTGTATINATAGNIVANGAIDNSASLQLNGIDFDLSGITNSGTGVIDINGSSVTSALSATGLNVTGGQVNLDVASAAITGLVDVSGDLYQGTNKLGMLNVLRDNATVDANGLKIGGAFTAATHKVTYTIANLLEITGDIDVLTGADASMSAKQIKAGNVNNSGTLALNSISGSTLGTVINNGALTLGNGGDSITSVARFTNSATGTVMLTGAGLDSTGIFTTPGTLYQNYAAQIQNGDVAITAPRYELTASNVTVAGISQSSGRMVMNTSDITVGGNITATDLRIAANPATDWLHADITGSVSGGVQFIGLEHMSIGGNYTFNNNSIIHAAILGNKDSVAPYTYWATVSLNSDDTLGQITNTAGNAARPLISVGGKLISNVTSTGNALNGGALQNGQVGIDIFSIVDPGTAIWLLKADGGVARPDWASNLRNLNVNFCNADGSLCFNYFDSIRLNNDSGTADGTPAYISVRDSKKDGNADSLYIVFDPRFGGPVEVFRIQPIVGREVYHTTGEYVSAGALDNLISGQLRDYRFYNRTPIEAIPLVFRGTNMEYMANELYNRMEQYNLDRNGSGLARFSRLMQAREIEQIAGSVALNEHTSFRSFEDHMFNEFIWNRHRNLKKAWADVDFGMFDQKVSDAKRVDGNRFSITGGFDLQDSPTLILGLAGHVSHMSSENSDSMDLGYRPGEFIAGHVCTDVADTNIGIGGYLIKTLGLKTRAYGNAFLDAHILDVSRRQNYVGNIDGIGTAFSLISEWGLMHDWLNQYVVGNLYARAGYNSGFSVKEKVSGDEYMRLKSDGYMILTPGYSLTAQKRIYPSSWFQIRPYASVGMEYDVLGAPDSAKYKFAPAKSYTKYDINIDPFWANIGGGVELISATGIQVGLDYRYQYNTDIQLHNIKISGSYRF